MLVTMIIRLSALSLGLSYVVATTPQQQSQLATLHERMNQMISALYSSPLLSKVQAATPSSEDFPSTAPEATYSYPAAPAPQTSYSYPTAPAPQVVYVAPPGYLEAGGLPDFGFSTANPVPRPAWPYSYDYSSYQPQLAPPVYSPSYAKSPYPEYSRPAYPQVPAPQPAVLPPALPLSAPLPYPPYLSQLQYSTPAPFPMPVCQPGFPVAPPLPAPYPAQIPYPPSSFPAQMPYPLGYPPSPYTAPMPAPYPSPVPQHYAPSFPYPPTVPVPYPPSIPYSPIPYPQPLYPPPPVFSKPSDILPQPQYDYSS